MKKTYFFLCRVQSGSENRDIYTIEIEVEIAMLEEEAVFSVSCVFSNQTTSQNRHLAAIT